MTTKEYSKRRYNERKAKGLCQWCDQAAEPGRIRCATHREITRDYNAGRRDLRTLNGLCANCGKHKVIKFKTCLSCRSKNRFIQEVTNK